MLTDPTYTKPLEPRLVNLGRVAAFASGLATALVAIVRAIGPVLSDRQLLSDRIADITFLGTTVVAVSLLRWQRRTGILLGIVLITSNGIDRLFVRGNFDFVGGVLALVVFAGFLREAAMKAPPPHG